MMFHVEHSTNGVNTMTSYEVTLTHARKGKPASESRHIVVADNYSAALELAGEIANEYRASDKGIRLAIHIKELT